MLGMSELEVDGLRWGYTYLQTDHHLEQQDRISLLTLATLMYLRGVDEKRVKTKNYEGKLTKTKSFTMLGCFSGPEFRADIETNKGKSKLRFIVSEQTSGIYRNN